MRFRAVFSIGSNRKFGDEGTRHLAAALKNNKHVTLLRYGTYNCALCVSACMQSLSPCQQQNGLLPHNRCWREISG